MREKRERESENMELVVDRHVLICFFIGKCVDEMLFDVVPMEAGHLLESLGSMIGMLSIIVSQKIFI